MGEWVVVIGVADGREATRAPALIVREAPKAPMRSQKIFMPGPNFGGGVG